MTILLLLILLTLSKPTDAESLSLSVSQVDSLYCPPRDSVLQRIQTITQFDSYLRRQQTHKALIAYARLHALREELIILRKQLGNLRLIYEVLDEKQKRSEVADVDVIQHEQQLLNKHLAIAGHIYQIQEVILTLCQLANIEIIISPSLLPEEGLREVGDDPQSASPTETQYLASPCNPEKGWKYTMLKHPLPKYFTITEKEALYEGNQDERNRCIFSLGLNGGLRASEIINLKLDDIDWENYQLRYPAKGGRERIIPMNLRLRIDLSLALEHRPPEVQHNYVVWNKRNPASGITRHGLYALVRRSGKRAGLKRGIHPHMLRHTAATDFYRSCNDIYMVQRFLGHSRIDSTTRYAQVDDKEIQNTLQTVNRPNWLTRLLAAFRSFQPEWLFNKPASIHSFFNGTVGRQKELAMLKQNMERGVSTVVIGERGSGKSHLLRLLSGEDEA